MDRFVSNITLRLDSKGRVSIPAQFRSVLARDGFDGLYCYPALDQPAIDAGGNALLAEIEHLIRRFPSYSTDREELLVAGAYFLLIILMVAFFVAVAIAGGITALLVALVVHSMSNAAMVATSVLCVVAGVLAVIAAFIYFAVRLAFFVVPVTVCEGEFGVFRSWELSKGHFWPIFAVLLLTWLPLIVVAYAIWGAVIVATILPAILHAVSATGAHNPALAREIVGIIWTSAQQNWPWLVALAVVPLPVVYGLMLSPAAFVYRQLKPALVAPAAGP